MILTRRQFFSGAVALLAAPAIVRASSIMSVVPVGMQPGLIDSCSFRAVLSPRSKDDTAWIQARIDKAARGGARYYLPPGVYNVSDLKVRENTVIRGSVFTVPMWSDSAVVLNCGAGTVIIGSIGVGCEILGPVGDRATAWAV